MVVSLTVQQLHKIYLLLRHCVINTIGCLYTWMDPVAKILKMLTSSNMISTYKTPDCNSVILFLFPHSPDQQYNSIG